MRTTSILAAVAALALGAATLPQAHGQTAVSVAVDLDVSGNQPRSLGSIDDCASVDSGDEIDIDIVLPDPGVPPGFGIKAWQLELNYDPAVVNVVDEDVDQLLAQANGSQLFGALSDTLPDSDGNFLSAGFDNAAAFQSEPQGAQEVGPGVITRITLSAVAPGQTNLTLSGVILVDAQNNEMALDQLIGAAVAVGQPCTAPPAPTSVPAGGQPDGDVPPPNVRDETPEPGTPGSPPGDDGDGAGPTDGEDRDTPAPDAETGTRIGIDADSEGNSATSLGEIQECVEISQGESHTIDIFVRDVDDLLAWQASFAFESGVLEVTDVQTDLFLAASEGSDVQDVSGDLPDDDGRYPVVVFDASDPAAPETGSGVLARLTLRAVGPGVSELRLPLSDLDADGSPDDGPLLRDVDVNSIGDEDGDTLFDGPIADARIAVDASCGDQPGPAPGADSGDVASEDDDVDALVIIVAVVGTLAAIAVGAAAAAFAIRRRRSAQD